MDAECFGMASRPLQRYAFAGERVQLGDFRNAIDHKSILGGITRLPCDPPAGSCNGEDNITAGRAALRDFKLAYVSSGSMLLKKGS